MILFAGCWFAAIIAMAFGNEHLAAILFAAGAVAGWHSDRRDRQHRANRAAHDRLTREVRRHG